MDEKRKPYATITIRKPNITSGMAVLGLLTLCCIVALIMTARENDRVNREAAELAAQLQQKEAEFVELENELDSLNVKVQEQQGVLDKSVVGDFFEPIFFRRWPNTVINGYRAAACGRPPDGIGLDPDDNMQGLWTLDVERTVIFNMRYDVAESLQASGNYRAVEDGYFDLWVRKDVRHEEFRGSMSEFAYSYCQRELD